MTKNEEALLHCLENLIDGITAHVIAAPDMKVSESHRILGKFIQESEHVIKGIRK